MEITLRAEPPTPLAQDPGEAPRMPAHELRTTSDSVWKAPLSVSSTGSFTMDASGTFPRVPVLVPRTAPVLTFSEDGTPEGHVTQELADWATAEIDKLNITPKQFPWSGTSGACPTTWPADYGLVWQCTLPAGHSDDIRCEAQGVKGAVLASPTETVVTEALKPARRKPTPRPRVQKAQVS